MRLFFFGLVSQGPQNKSWLCSGSNSIPGGRRRGELAVAVVAERDSQSCGVAEILVSSQRLLRSAVSSQRFTFLSSVRMSAQDCVFAKSLLCVVEEGLRGRRRRNFGLQRPNFLTSKNEFEREQVWNVVGPGFNQKIPNAKSVRSPCISCNKSIFDTRIIYNPQHHLSLRTSLENSQPHHQNFKNSSSKTILHKTVPSSS